VLLSTHRCQVLHATSLPVPQLVKLYADLTRASHWRHCSTPVFFMTDGPTKLEPRVNTSNQPQNCHRLAYVHLLTYTGIYIPIIYILVYIIDYSLNLILIIDHPNRQLCPFVSLSVLPSVPYGLLACKWTCREAKNCCKLKSDIGMK